MFELKNLSVGWLTIEKAASKVSVLSAHVCTNDVPLTLSQRGTRQDSKCASIRPLAIAGGI